MYILCTKGTPLVDRLDHLPPLPLFVNYRDSEMGYVVRDRRVTWERVAVSGEDQLGINHALQLRNRVRHIDLHLPLSTLNEFLMLMNGPFPILEHLSLSFPADKVTTLSLPKTFMAPNIRHLSLLGVALPKRLRLLTSTVSLVSLNLTNIQASGYFRPRLLVARLQSHPQLEELSIEFSIPIPRPSAERLLLGEQGTPVILSKLKKLAFRGVSAYLEHLLSQMKAPLLERLDITLFNQIAFTLPHLSHFISTTERIKFLSTGIVRFGGQASIILADRNMEWGGIFERLILHVMCKQTGWQIDCVAQICIALMPALSGVDMLTLDNKYGWDTPALTRLELRNDVFDDMMWHDLLRSFGGVKRLCVDYWLSEGLSHALEVDEIGLDPGLLPGLQDLESTYNGVQRDILFGAFIESRRVAGRPVALRLPPSLPSGGIFGQPSPLSQ